MFRVEKPQRMPRHMHVDPLNNWHKVVDASLASEALFVPLHARMSGRIPHAVYMGIGLCTQKQLAIGLPMDVLGMLIPAERLRAALGAEHLVVLVADAHAESNGFSADEIARTARRVIGTLLRIRIRRKLYHLRIIRASRLQKEPGYQNFLQAIRSRAEGEGNEYAYRQTADVAFLNQQLGGLLKLGWTVDITGASGGGYRDEVAFDRVVKPWSGEEPSFAYVRCGRALDNRKPKVSPYIGTDRTSRVYLCAHETPAQKLMLAGTLASHRNTKAFREHLSLIADAWGVAAGPVEERLNQILSELYPGSYEPCLRDRHRTISVYSNLAVDLKRH
ncbi:MAG: hypothetical protein KTR25_07955 [Myxococcales bacterium]|nr:hypothetical protein [Myxococcales bacterium]